MYSEESKLILNEVSRTLMIWDYWGTASKAAAVFLGVMVTAGGALISSKQLSNTKHYIVAAIVAGSAFAYGLLQPYEEYKQFRKAFYNLDNARLAFIKSQKTDSDIDELLKKLKDSREVLEEKWESPTVNTGGKGQP